MGNSYSRELAQWSKGEYAGADRRTRTTWRCSPRTSDTAFDDHGDTTPTATLLAGSRRDVRLRRRQRSGRRVHGRRTGRRHRRPGDAVVDGVEPVRLGHDPQRARRCRRAEHPDRGRRRAAGYGQPSDRLGCPRDARSCPTAGTRSRSGPPGSARRRPASARTARTARTASPSPSARTNPPPAPALPGQVRLTPIQPRASRRHSLGAGRERPSRG